MPKVLIVADDLTGAADTGAQFARRGWRTLLALYRPASPLGGRHPARAQHPTLRAPEAKLGGAGSALNGLRKADAPAPEAATETDVLVISTDSRALPTDADAAQALRSVLADFPLTDFSLVYKKIDSTLRGHPAAELAALLEILGQASALIAPAFPAQGRTTRGGVVYVHGLPLEQTSFGAGLDQRGAAGQPPDPPRLSQAGGGDLTRLFGGASRAALLPIPVVQAGLMAIRNSVAGNPGLCIADAETDRDLRLLAQAGLDLGRRVLCGSAGLANALADCLGPNPAASVSLDPALRPSSGAVLALAGSLHPATAAQVLAACRQGAGLIQPPVEFFAAPGLAGLAETADHLAAALARGGPVILATQAPSPPAPALDSGEMARKLAQAAVLALARTPVAGLFLTGGDTARALCQELGCTRLWLGGEVEPGIPWARMADGPLAGLPVVTKAGGFGGEDSLAGALRFLGAT